jgi:hypothetical protein
MFLPHRYLKTVVAASAIWVSHAPAQELRPVALRVRVVDATTGLPLGGAVVQLSGVGERYVSDEGGEASFRIAAGSYILTARRFGYEPIEGDFRVIRQGSFTLRMTPRVSEDASAPGRLTGRVVEARSGRVVRGASVSVSGLGQYLSDDDGRFEVPRLSAGLKVLVIEALGYAGRTVSVTVQPGRTTVLEVSVAVDALELPPIEVEVRSPFLESRGVYRRMEGGRSAGIVTRAEIEGRDSYRLSDSMTGVSGLRVERRNKRSVLLGRGRCRMRVFVDGVPVSPEMDGTVDIDLFPPEWIEVAEVYVGISAVPVEYADVGEDCGVVLLWTRQRAG